MANRKGLGQWLKDRLEEEHLDSLRKARDKIGLSHSTIRDILSGVIPQGETVQKLAAAFSQGDHARWALEDHLLVLAGYRSAREGEETKPAVGKFRDMVAGFTDAQLEVVISFVRLLNDATEAMRGASKG